MMAARLGSARFDENGMMTRGIIVRHLLLPGQLRESIRVLDYLYGEYGNSIYYSLMSQYTPLPTLPETYPELRRRVTTYEYQKLIDHACSLGITSGFIQDGRSAKESFIPAFNGEGVE
jgi:putative pyruvate formate lyase activating enzyme